jgi:hypothetical protein
MIGGVQRMAVRDFRVVCRFLVVPGFVVLRRVAMMLFRFVVVMRGFLVVLVNVVIQHPLLGWGCRNIAGHHERFATRILQKETRGQRLGLNRNKRANAVDNELHRKRRKHHAKKPR